MRTSRKEEEEGPACVFRWREVAAPGRLSLMKKDRVPKSEGELGPGHANLREEGFALMGFVPWVWEECSVLDFVSKGNIWGPTTHD